MPPEPSPVAMTGTPARDDLLEVLRVELRAVGDEIPDELPADRTLGEELGIDSLDVVEFVARVEYRYQVLVPDEDWQQLMTLDAVADYMLGRLRDG